jgi:uncharacterized membrane protein
MREGDFRVRGKEISRIEGLSDAVFGFAITLLAISLEVPKTSAEVLHALRGVGAFAVTFLILFNMWRTQYTFFRRYGLDDKKIVILTGVLLFVLLVFVYPLKFMMNVISEKLMYLAGFPDPAFDRLTVLTKHDFPIILGAFGLGMAAVFGAFNAMYRHAYGMRDALQLDAVERFDTLEQIRTTAVVIALGLAIGVLYLLASSIPSAANAFGNAAAAIMLLSCVAIVRQRRTRSSRRAAVRAAAHADHADHAEPAHA